MNKTETELMNYLNDNPKFIEDTLNMSLINYEIVKIVKVNINNCEDTFSVRCLTHENSGHLISPYFPIPVKFLRKLKLKKLLYL